MRYFLESNSSFLLVKESSDWFKAARFVRPEFVLLGQNDSVLSFPCSANDLDMRTFDFIISSGFLFEWSCLRSF